MIDEIEWLLFDIIAPLVIPTLYAIALVVMCILFWMYYKKRSSDMAKDREFCKVAVRGFRVFGVITALFSDKVTYQLVDSLDGEGFSSLLMFPLFCGKAALMGGLFFVIALITLNSHSNKGKTAAAVITSLAGVVNIAFSYFMLSYVEERMLIIPIAISTVIACILIIASARTEVYDKH